MIAVKWYRLDKILNQKTKAAGNLYTIQPELWISSMLLKLKLSKIQEKRSQCELSFSTTRRKGQDQRAEH